MFKRLDITLFGALYCVSAVRLTPEILRVGTSAYGQTRWHDIISRVALGEASSKLNREVVSLLGQPLTYEYRGKGISLNDPGFGMEVFHGGEHVPVTMVQAENRTLQPVEVMRHYRHNDMLGVYWGRRQGAIHFRWDHVETMDQEEVSLAYDTLTPLLAVKHGFEMTNDIAWKGEKGRRRDLGECGILSDLRHVFHRAK